MLDHRLSVLERRLRSAPEDVDAWIDLARLVDRAGTRPDFLDGRDHGPALGRALTHAPRERSLSRLLVPLLGLVPVVCWVPPRHYADGTRCEQSEEGLRDLASGLPLRVLRQADGAEMVLVPEGLRRPTVRERLRALAGSVSPPSSWAPPFYVDRHPVTVARFERFQRLDLGDPPRRWEVQRIHPLRPVVGVTIAQAEGYARRVGAAVPSEVEWDRAAGGPTGNRYPWGDEDPTPEHAMWGTATTARRLDGLELGLGEEVFSLPEIRELPEVVETRPEDLHESPTDSLEGLRSIGERPAGASPFGAEDMAGSVHEWCRDELPGGGFRGHFQAGFRGGFCGRFEAPRAARGGSFRSAAEEIEVVSQALRDGARGYLDGGFRLVVELAPEDAPGGEGR